MPNDGIRDDDAFTVQRANASCGRICSYVTKTERANAAAAHAMSEHDSSGSRYTSTHSESSSVGARTSQPAAPSARATEATSRRSAVSSS